MFVRAYLRASTEDQNAERARAELTAFAKEHGHAVASYYVENVSGATLDRPELQRLLADAQPGDVLLLEQVDRLTRLKDEDWQQLKRQIEDKGLSVVAKDLPTSYQAFDVKDGHDFMRSMLKAINTMMLDMLAAIARKDYEDRRKRQSQGIQQAKDEGKYQGRKADAKRHQKVIELRGAGHSLNDVAKLTGYSKATVCRILAQGKTG
ncbi:recombinase family protein [Oceanisphaera sp. KMM 10153]|uniref:recombinase family protein n=1 Tax=Oceanisphaera submarina TaxID=3390193 RepID=UPI003977086B